MLSVSKMESINIILYMLPCSQAACLDWICKRRASVRCFLPPVLTLPVWGACLPWRYVPFPVAPTAGLGSSLTSASLPWAWLAILVWIGKSFPGGTACLQRSLENTEQSLRRQGLFWSQLGLFPECLTWREHLPYLLVNHLLVYAPSVLLGRGNLFIYF